MDRQVFHTALGEVWLWGERPVLDRPVVLVIHGAFAIPRPALFSLQELLPGATVLNAHLPGNHSPPLAHASVGVYAAAYSEVLRRIDRPVIAVGASVGALTALALRAPNLAGLVLLDPPLVTGKLWPLIADFRRRLAAQPEVREFLWSVFGVGEATLECRDYRGLLEGLSLPAWALVGSEPLYPERPFEKIPSLVDEPERELLRACPTVRFKVVDGVGHNVGGPGRLFVRTAVRDLLVSVLGTRQESPAGASAKTEAS